MASPKLRLTALASLCSALLLVVGCTGDDPDSNWNSGSESRQVGTGEKSQQGDADDDDQQTAGTSSEPVDPAPSFGGSPNVPDPNTGAGGCTAVGCGTSIVRKETFPPGTTFERIRALEYRLCRNEQCWTGQHLANAEEPRLGEALGASPSAGTFVGPISPSLTVSRRDSDEFVLHILWYSEGSDPLQLTSADRYSYQVGDSGSVLFEHEQTVTYEVFYPNGPGCAPACKRAVTSN